MPKIITETVYLFDELNDRAKERARDWYREGMETNDFAESVIEDAVRIGRMLGIEIGTHSVKLMNGTTRQEPTVYWALHIQGAGACFPGRYHYVRGSVHAIEKEAPPTTDSNKELHRIARELAALQKTHNYLLEASISLRGGAQHSGDMRITVTNARTGNEYFNGPAAEELPQLLRDFADWIYRGLDQEYMYQTSDEVVDENIRANEYTFTATGTRRG
jgi:hypothetical protein